MQLSFKSSLLAGLAALYLFMLSPLGAQDAASIQKKLEAKYAVTVINAEGGVVIAGSTLTLKKSGLKAGAFGGCTNEYKEGKFGLSGGSKFTCAGAGKLCAFCAPAPVGGTQPVRVFVTGEKLYVTKIEAIPAKDEVQFFLISDFINDAFFRAELKFHLAKGAPLDFGTLDQMISEVFSSTLADNQQQGGQQNRQQPNPPQVSQRPSTPAPPVLAPDAPPPPPPDAAPAARPNGTPGITQGMTIDQVVAIMGQPGSTAVAGSKKIYSYPNLKVTFVDGKVSATQPL